MNIFKNFKSNSILWNSIFLAFHPIHFLFNNDQVFTLTKNEASMHISEVFANQDPIHLHCELGDTITISLDAAFSTGYSWQVYHLDDALNLISKSHDLIPEGNFYSDVQIYNITPSKAGKYKLSLKYSRPFEPKNNQTKTIHYIIQVI